MKSAERQGTGQQGSVLVYILLAVALFASLSYAVSRMMRGGESIGQENRAVMVNDVLGYARTMKEGIQALRISNGCEETQISFERSPFDGSDTNYVNTSAPSDFSCHVFHPQGGGLGAAKPLSDITTQDYVFTGSFGVTDLGSDSEAELALIMRDIGLDFCTEINSKLGMPAPLTDISSSADFYTSTFDGSYVLTSGVGDGINTGNAAYNAKMAGCFLENNVTAGEYFFYQVLIPR